MEVSAEETYAAKLLAVQEEIAEATPDRCKDCYRPGLKAFNQAREVVAGDISIEEAQENLEVDIGKYCIYGATDRGGCFGGTRCNYGLIIN